jgi:arylsulfatase A-like enzyme
MTMMTPRRQVLAALAGAAAAALAVGPLAQAQAPSAPAAAADRPNIVFIMTDDHAAHAISAYGSTVNTTPNLDRIAREGALFTSVFATNSICTPSRATILTGQYSHLNGVTMFNRFDSTRMTVARLLQQGGYYTGMIGKWHLGSDPQGFDRWEIFPGQGVYDDPILYTATGEKQYTGRYATDVVTELALDFIDHRPAGKPFFLMMHHKAPHRPWTPNHEHGAEFAGRRIPEPATLWDDYESRTDALHENKQRISDLTKTDVKQDPPPGLTGDALTRWKYQRYMQDYLATVQSVDDSVGQVLARLDAAGLARNTIVVYTSDQGFFLGDHGLFDKRFMYEESIRMPFLVRWPAVIAPGRRIDAMGLNVDFAPTFLDAAGLPPSPDMQGRSLVPIMKGRTPADWRTSMYYRYYHDPGHHNTRAHYGVRTKTHKLIYFWKKDQWELYDLVEDPHELHNLYGKPGMATLTATLKTELARLKKAAKDDDQLADVQIPQGVDGTVQELRGK